MSDLHERLAALAEDAPVASEPGDLWRRGRRHRTRQLLATGAAATAVAAVVALGATVGLQRTQSLPEPAAPPDTALVLPDTVFGPSEWLGLLGSIGEGDRPGPLVALMSADLGGWTGTERGPVVVTADQEYRVLDLPGARSGVQPVLSPDGSHVAYRDADGLAAYDAQTGRIDRVPVPDAAGDPTWLGDAVVVRVPGGAAAWTVGEDAAVTVDAPRAVVTALPAEQTTTPVVVEVGVLELLLLREPADLAGEPVTEVDGVLTGNVVVSPDGTRVAAVIRSPGGGRLAVGELTPGTTTLALVPGAEPVDGSLLGWRDERSVVTSALSFAGELTRIDVETGRQTTLTTGVSPNGYPVQLAADALTAPVVPGVAPPSPPDPRWVAGGAAAVTFAGLCGLVWWRGRRRVR